MCTLVKQRGRYSDICSKVGQSYIPLFEQAACYVLPGCKYYAVSLKYCIYWKQELYPQLGLGPAQSPADIPGATPVM